MTSSISRFTVMILCAAMASLPCVGGSRPWMVVPAVFFALLTLVGLRDLVQARHSILCNYPVIGHVLWFVELVRPEIRQYLFEADEEAAPFSRAQRALVYRRAKGEAADHPFGTLLDVYGNGYEFINHSITPMPVADPASFRITIGGEQCTNLIRRSSSTSPP